MRPFIVSIILLSFIFPLKAQLIWRETNPDMVVLNYALQKTRKNVPKDDISSYYVYKYEVGKSDTGSIYNGKSLSQIPGQFVEKGEYDTMGNFIEYFKYNSRGKIVLHSTTMHDRQGRDTQYTEFRRNGKFFRGFTFKYDKNGEETDERMFWRKPEHMTWHNTYKYDSSRNMIESISSIKNDKKIISKYTYSYYPDGSKKQTIGYDGKGSITHLWNYECNPEGTINTRKLKDTSKVCVRYETDKDGNKIKIREEMVHEGRIVRKIIKYNKAGYTLETAGYNKKGIALYRNIFSYNGEGRLSESVYYKPKSNEINHKYHYQYDKNGNCIKFVSYKSANPEEAGIIYRIIYM